MASDLLPRALNDLLKTVGIEGAAVIALSNLPSIRCEAGFGSEAIPNAAALLIRKRATVGYGLAPDRRPLLICPMDTRTVLALWRMPGEAGWTIRDYPMITAVAGLLRLMQQPAQRDANLDPVTGLSHQAHFLSAVDRHIGRLDAAGATGTMLLVSPDRRAGLQFAGDADDSLFQTARMLSAVLRPADRIGYIAADMLAAWLDNADHMTTAERAESLVQRRVPDKDDTPLSLRRTLSIGIATRPGGSLEDAASLLVKATQALDAVRREGGNGWRVAATESIG